MAKLSSQGRKQVKRSNYAVPKGSGSDPNRDQYPIHDKRHAQNALSRVSQHGTPSEKSQVRRAVADKYPNVGQQGGGSKSSGSRRKRK